MRTRNRRRSSTTCRSMATSTGNSCIVDAELSKGKFSYIYKNSSQGEVNVKHCVPLFHTRMLCNSAVRGLIDVLDVDETGTEGFSYAGGLKVVVKIPDEELHIVEQHFLEVGQRETESKELAFSRGICWYGIVDGIHIHKALRELENARPDPFQDFKWTVTVIKWQSIGVLKAFARARNQLQSENIVEMTLFDIIQGIHEFAVEKSNLAGEPLETFARHHGMVTKIADEFCGGSKYSRQTTRTLTGASLRIKPEALVVLGSIMCEENQSLAKRIMQQCSGENSSDVTVFDTRAFKKIISTNTIRSATEFLNADGRDQINALRRLKSGYESNGFKTFQAAHLNKDTERSARARRQISLMNDLMHRDRWPEELADVEIKLVTTSVFDSELDNDEYGTSTNNIMESLITEYKNRMPLEAGLRWQLYCRDRPSYSEACQRNAGQLQSPVDGNSGAVSEHNDGVGEVSFDAEPDEAMDSGAGSSCPLEQIQIECFRMTLQSYAVNRKPDDDRFDFVTGDPSQVQLNGTCKIVIGDSQADKYVGILKQLVNEHGWVVFYTTASDFEIWSKTFPGNGFEPLPYPWIMVRNSNTVQINTSPLPQSITEILIGARKIGTGRPKYQPNITSNYKRAVSTHKRKFALMDSCDEPRLKLRKLNTREPLRTNQRSQEPIAEFLDTFCPIDGRVLDAFAGTMETAKACMMTGRSCVALEADSFCYDVAFENLKETALQYLSQNVRNEQVRRDSSRQFSLAGDHDNDNKDVAIQQEQESMHNREINQTAQDSTEDARVQMSDVSNSPGESDGSNAIEERVR